MTLKSVNPATEEILATFEPYNDAHIAAAVEEADKAFYTHRQTGVKARAAELRTVATVRETALDVHGLQHAPARGKVRSY